VDWRLWILDLGDAKNGIFPFDFFWNWGTPMLLFTQTFFFWFWIVECGLWIGDWKSKTEILFFMVGENKKNALHLRARRV